MTKLKNRHILNVFIATPGDLLPERKALRELVAEINQVIEYAFNISIDLIGWEDTLPGTGRPQSLINPEIDRCDLFIGVLWMRWGSNPGGEYTSGFEEEFIRAMQRNKSTSQPEVWVFFKSIASEFLNDPGEQTKKVLAFKTQQEQKKEVMYTEFTSEEWTSKVRTLLFKYVSKIAVESAFNSESQSVARISHFTTSNPLLDMSIKGVESQSNEIKSLDTTSFINAYWSMRDVILSRIRERLDSQEANLIYYNRQSITNNSSQLMTIIVSIVSDNQGIVPGWFWFQEKTCDQVVKNLVKFIVESNDLNIMARSMEWMCRKSIKVEDNRIITPLFQLLSECSKNQIEALVSFILTTNHNDAVFLLDEVEKNVVNDLKNIVRGAKLHVEIDIHGVESAIGRYLESDESIDIRDETINLLEAKRGEFSDDVIKRMMSAKNYHIKVLAFDVAENRGLLSKDDAYRLLKEESTSFKGIALKCLSRIKEPLSDEDIDKNLPASSVGFTLAGLASYGTISKEDVYKVRFQQLEKSDVIQKIDWYRGAKGAVAYEVYLEKAGLEAAQIARKDLEDSFQSIIQRSFNKMEQSYGIEKASDIARQWDDLKDYMHISFADVAISFLSNEDGESDIFWARNLLRLSRFKTMSKDVSVSKCVAIIRKFGSIEDVDLLLKCVTGTSGDNQRVLAEAAVSFIADDPKRLRELANSEITTLSCVVLDRMRFQLDSYADFIFSKLYDSSWQIRTYAARLLISLPRERLESLLLRYHTEQDTYYFDVIAIFDEALYAPYVRGR